jgi:hypothetical protein
MGEGKQKGRAMAIDNLKRHVIERRLGGGSGMSGARKRSGGSGKGHMRKRGGSPDWWAALATAA